MRQWIFTFILLSLPLGIGWSEPQPPVALEKVVVKVDLNDSAALFGYLTAADTPYIERRGAAVQGRLKGNQIFQLYKALQELHLAGSQGNFGVLPSPYEARPYFPNSQSKFSEILGQKFQPPQPKIAYPQTWEQQCQAPWPWQVQIALREQQRTLVPHSQEEAATWLRNCLTFPQASDEECQLFADAILASSHWSSAEILERVRATALNPKRQQAALRVSSYPGRMAPLWQQPLASELCQAVVLDILQRSPHSGARQAAAYTVPQLGQRFRQGKMTSGPMAAACVQQLLSMAADPRQGSEWDRLYCYGFSACEAMERSPIEVDRRLSPQSPKVAQLLLKLEQYHEIERQNLNKMVLSQKPALDQAQRKLKDCRYNSVDH